MTEYSDFMKEIESLRRFSANLMNYSVRALDERAKATDPYERMQADAASEAYHYMHKQINQMIIDLQVTMQQMIKDKADELREMSYLFLKGSGGAVRDSAEMMEQLLDLWNKGRYNEDPEGYYD